MLSTFHVRVIKSGGDKSWYRNEIGQSFEVVDFTADYYLLVETLGTFRQLLLSKNDVEIVQ